MPTSVLLRLDGWTDVGADLTPVWRAAAPAAPLLPAAAVGAGSEGVFETIAVIDGVPHALAPHLERLIASAKRCAIPSPDARLWERGVAAAVGALDPADALALTVVLYAGDAGGPTTGWIAGRVAPDFGEVRATGVRVAVLDRGVLHAAPAPWLRLDAKTLSYAVAGAAVREARRRGADEVVFRSTDGFLLEAATASILLRAGDVLRTPGHGAGVLAGTTVARLLAVGLAAGLGAEAVPLPIDALARADAAWLVSSVRGAVPITAVDGRALRHDPDLTAVFRAALGPAGRT